MHALLSASSAHRWLTCTPSARLEEQFEDTKSPSAAEGTLAHAIAELKVTKYALEPMSTRTFNTKYNKLKKNELYIADMDTDTEEYLDYIKEIMISYKDIKPFVTVEKKVDFSKYVQDGFGTADCIIIANDDLHIIDLKYGKKNMVMAHENPQLKLYALGAIEEYSLFYNIQNVHLHIFQPRMNNIGQFDISVSDLQSWGESIKETAQMAYMGIGNQVTGEHCRFCKASAICRARADENLELAKYEFKTPPLLTNDEVGVILKQAEDLADWAKKLKEYALSEVLKGNDIQGWKAVAGRTTRTFTSIEDVFKQLIDSGIDESMLYEKKPLTLTAIETLLGKKDFADKLSEFITKSEGKPTLVGENDKRPALKKESAIDEFIGGQNNE